MKKAPTILIIVATLGCLSSTSNAAIMIMPVLIQNSLGEFNPTFSDENLTNNSLTNPYVSGVTDFQTYFTEGSSDNSTPWVASAGNASGSLVFDLGENYEIKTLVLWNDGTLSPGSGTKDISLEIDDNLSFSNPTSVLFSTITGTSSMQALGGIAFVSDPSAKVISRYLRLNINSTLTGGTNASMSEVAFAVDAVPEPSQIATILGLFSVFVCLLRRRPKI